MKGIVFTEFLDFVERSYSADMVDDIIDDGNLDSGGAYTAVGTYDHRELQALIGALSQRSGVGVPELLTRFGTQLSGRFAKNYPAFFHRCHDFFDFIESVDRHIHVEVHKLYPDAELPSFETHARTQDLLELNYRSCRPFAALAVGMILGAAGYFEENIEVAQHAHTDDAGNFVRLSVQRVS